MKYSRALPSLCAAGLSLAVQVAQAADENIFLEKIQQPLEQTVGHGRSALWALPDVATQYQPSQPVPAIREALQAQQEGRFLDALIRLEDAARSGQGGEESLAEINLLRASFLLQGHQAAQALEILTPLSASTRHAATVHALTAMAHLQQGVGQKALEAAQQAQKAGDGLLSNLALSYALQGEGRLAEARDTVHGFNGREPQQAVALAREAELELTLDQPAAARALTNRAQQLDAAHPYVAAVSGLVYLIDGEAKKAKAAFEAALKRDSQDAKALFGLGLAEIRLGNFAEGQKKLEAAHGADPGSALIATYLARAQLRAGQTSEAMEHLLDAQEADPKDPVPWLYQAQAELQANRPQQAQESLREAQARTAYRKVYRGENLIREDEQQLQANLAEAQRRLGQEDLAFHTLADSVGEKNAATLRNQADLLQGRRFGESARRSLLLQSLFNERPGNLPSALDIYGDGLGQTGASTPQHGVVSGLSAQYASYQNYDALFGQRTLLSADAIGGSRNTSGEQIRMGVGNDILGLSLAGLQFKTDGYAPYQNLNNRVAQGVVQWLPTQSTQTFISYQVFNSRRGEVTCPADPNLCAVGHQYEDSSSITRLGLRQRLTDSSELRGLISHQWTGQIDNQEWMSDFLPPANPFYTGPPGSNAVTYNNSSAAKSVELQYRNAGAGYTTQLGVSLVRSVLNLQIHGTPLTNVAQQIYVNRQQALNPHWQLEAGLTWGKNDKSFRPNNNDISTYLRYWLPKLGLVYTPDSTMHVRLAAWKNLDDAALGNASLAPAQLAGIVLNRQSGAQNDAYNVVRGITLGADKQLGTAWLLEGQAQWRSVGVPFRITNTQDMYTMHANESRLALHWQPNHRALNTTLAYDDEYVQNIPGMPPDSIGRQHLRSLQLNLRWLAGSQWTANLAWSHNLLNATQILNDINFLPVVPLYVQQNFNQMDLSLSWRFSRDGSLDVGMRNATNTGIQYIEQDQTIPRFSQRRLTYVKAKLAW